MKPTNKSIARAFWMRYKSRYHGGETAAEFAEGVKADAAQLDSLSPPKQFDAESPAGTARGSEEVMQIETLGIQGERPVARGADSEAAPLSAGVMFMMIRQDEEKRAAAHEAALRKLKRTCTRPACRAEMRPGLNCGGPNCPLRPA